MPVVMPIAGPPLTILSPNGAFWTTWKSGSGLVREVFETKVLDEHPNELYPNDTDVLEASAEVIEPLSMN